jgi:hypothetical protein
MNEYYVQDARVRSRAQFEHTTNAIKQNVEGKEHALGWKSDLNAVLLGPRRVLAEREERNHNMHTHTKRRRKKTRKERAERREKNVPFSI